MHWALPIVALFLLTGCGGITDYDANTGSNSSYFGTQGGSGVQAPIWSDDPGKKTLTNQNPSQSPTRQ